MLRGIIGGIFGGLLGAGAWTIATALSGAQLGLGLWLVGLLTGVGVAIGMKREGCARAGYAAVLVALCAVGAGKAAGTPWIQADAAFDPAAAITETQAIAHIERDIQREWSDQGRVIAIADGRAVPPEVRAEAMRQWAQMSDPQRTHYLTALAETSAPKPRAALSTVSLLDALWFLLALATAFKVAAYARPAARSESPSPRRHTAERVCDDISSADWGKRITPETARLRKAA